MYGTYSPDQIYSIQKIEVFGCYNVPHLHEHRTVQVWIPLYPIAPWLHGFRNGLQRNLPSLSIPGRLLLPFVGQGRFILFNPLLLTDPKSSKEAVRFGAHCGVLKNELVFIIVSKAWCKQLKDDSSQTINVGVITGYSTVFLCVRNHHGIPSQPTTCHIMHYIWPSFLPYSPHPLQTVFWWAQRFSNFIPPASHHRYPRRIFLLVPASHHAEQGTTCPHRDTPRFP